MTHTGEYTFYQKCMSLAPKVNEGMCLGDFEEKYKLLGHWINDEAVFRTTVSLESSVNYIELKCLYQISLTIFLYFNSTQKYMKMAKLLNAMYISR